MEHKSDSLKLIPETEWVDVQNVLKTEWPICLPGYYSLETHRRLNSLGLDYGFKVYCPYGDKTLGMVGVNEKDRRYEIIMMAPKVAVKQFEEALRKTKVIDWKREMIVPFAPFYVVDCLENVVNDFGMIIESDISYLFMLDLNHELFEVELPPKVSFEKVSLEHADLIDSVWPHRYTNSVWVYQLLIKAGNGYGLFENNQLVSWLFISDNGFLLHLYTLKDYRRQGYGELIMKVVSNILFEEKKHPFGFCKTANVASYNLFKKMGFEFIGDRVGAWCFIQPLKKQ